MNERGLDALVQAALAGQKQIFGSMNDRRGGLCALGVLAQAAGVLDEPIGHRFSVIAAAYDLHGARKCPLSECSRRDPWRMSEAELIVHLNDHHRWDFLTIARKLGPEGGTP
jgi:hypothetical protein